jgi:hypothetical protein
VKRIRDETQQIHRRLDRRHSEPRLHHPPENAEADPKDRRLKENENGQRSVVAVMLERLGRTLPVVNMAEAEAVALVRANVNRMATPSADEAAPRDVLLAGLNVELSEIYSDHGKHTIWGRTLLLPSKGMVQDQHQLVTPRATFNIMPSRLLG